MISKRNKGSERIITTIEPYRIYTQKEIYKLLDCGRAGLIKKIKEKKLRFRKIGKGRIFLGEYLLEYFGSRITGTKKKDFGE